MNLNVSADDINTLKVLNTMGKFCQIFKMSNIWKSIIYKSESVDFFKKLCSVPNKVHVEVT